MLPARRPEILYGVPGLIAAATAVGIDMVVAAIVGAAGLVPTAAAIKAGKDVALANKETLVTAGRLIMEMVQEQGVRLYPVDSEHSAVFQSLQGHREEDVQRIILTASGGPFLNYSTGKARAGFHCRRAQPSQLEHGTKNLHRFRHHDEQGSGSDRSTLAVRYAAGQRYRLIFIPRALFTPWWNMSTAVSWPNSGFPT